MKRASVALLSLVLFLACDKIKEKIDDKMAGGSEEQTFAVSGPVVTYSTSRNTITMTHERLPGYAGMIASNGEVEYEVKGQNVDSFDFSGGGAWVKGTLHRKGSKWWLTDVSVSSPRSRPF